MLEVDILEGIWAGKGGDSQHSCHEDVGHQAERDVDKVGKHPISRSDHLKEGMSIWSFAFQLNGKSCEEQDLPY